MPPGTVTSCPSTSLGYWRWCRRRAAATCSSQQMWSSTWAKVGCSSGMAAAVCMWCLPVCQQVHVASGTAAWDRAHHTAACHCPNLVLPVFFVVQLTSSLSVSTPPPRHLVSVLARLLTSATGSLLHAWLPTLARARPSRLWLRSPLCRSRLQRLSARCGDRTASSSLPPQIL